ncbi:carbohydrate-binding module family 50 protein, partial [Macrolepiota fuliginosa MF-IS2]
FNLVSTVTASNPPDCDRPLYEVQSGDTCDSICSNHLVSNYQLRLVNPEINEACNNIFPGEKFCLGRKGQDCTDVHKVGPGENCWKIAHDAGISIELLVKNNPNLGEDCQFVRPKEV